MLIWWHMSFSLNLPGSILCLPYLISRLSKTFTSFFGIEQRLLGASWPTQCRAAIFYDDSVQLGSLLLWPPDSGDISALQIGIIRQLKASSFSFKFLRRSAHSTRWLISLKFNDYISANLGRFWITIMFSTYFVEKDSRNVCTRNQ